MDETVEHLVGGFKIPPMFVVGIDNGGDKRSSEYLPYPDAQNEKDTLRMRRVFMARSTRAFCSPKSCRLSRRNIAWRAGR